MLIESHFLKCWSAGSTYPDVGWIDLPTIVSWSNKKKQHDTTTIKFQLKIRYTFKYVILL